MSFVIPNVKLKHTKKPVLVMTDDTGKDLVDEIRRLRVALYATHDDKPEEDISIKNLMEENESYKNDIEEYKDRIRELECQNKELEDQNKEISDNIIKFLNELSDIFTDGDIPDDIDYREFTDMLCTYLREIKRSHKRFFKQNLLFHMCYGDIFTTKELKEYERQIGIG